MAFLDQIWLDTASRKPSTCIVMSKLDSGYKVTTKSAFIDTILTLIAWFLFTLWFKPHVMSYEPVTVVFWAGFSALPAAGTFWLCLQMYKVTAAHQRKLKEEKEEDSK